MNGNGDLAALRAEIAQTRAQLGTTVEELAGRVDVKARAKQTVEDVKERGSLAATRAKLRTRQLGYDLRTQPVETTRRAAARVRDSVRANPRTWAVTAAIMTAFVLLAARRRGQR
jgi:hypothetical protein